MRGYSTKGGVAGPGAGAGVAGDSRPRRNHHLGEHLRLGDHRDHSAAPWLRRARDPGPDRRGRTADRRGAPPIHRAGTGFRGARHRRHRQWRGAHGGGRGGHRIADRPGTAGHRTARRQRHRRGFGAGRYPPGTRHHRDQFRAGSGGGALGGRARHRAVPAQAVHVRGVPRQTRAIPAVPGRPGIRGRRGRSTRDRPGDERFAHRRPAQRGTQRGVTGHPRPGGRRAAGGSPKA